MRLFIGIIGFMTEQEPIDEFRALWSKLIQKIRVALRDKSHRDLKRTYGQECASILLREVPHTELYFRLDNGVVLKSLCDLADILPELDEKTFQKHVCANKNDFSAWVENVIGDKTLAKKLELLDCQADAARAVAVRVNWFKSRIQ